ncbi:MAG TPA: hypothetical protein VI168_03400 [Croceibacterium sp.]
MRILWIGGLVLLVAGGAAAQDAPSEASGKDEQICKTERVTGSRARRTRICMTQDEWDRLRRETKQGIEDIQRNSGAVPRQQSGAGAAAGAG